MVSILAVQVHYSRVLSVFEMRLTLVAPFCPTTCAQGRCTLFLCISALHSLDGLDSLEVLYQYYSRIADNFPESTT